MVLVDLVLSLDMTFLPSQSVLVISFKTHRFSIKHEGFDEILEIVPHLEGQIKWNVSDRIRTLTIPVNGDNLNYCDELEVHMKLTTIRMAFLRETNILIAKILGTPKGFCPPGQTSFLQFLSLMSHLKEPLRTIARPEHCRI